jgi:hypothetical protein
VNVEFGRTFRDIYQIGTLAKEKWAKAMADKTVFSVRRPNDCAELPNSKNRNEVTKANADSQKQLMKSNYDRLQVR